MSNSKLDKSNFDLSEVSNALFSHSINEKEKLEFLNKINNIKDVSYDEFKEELSKVLNLNIPNQIKSSQVRIR